MKLIEIKEAAFAYDGKIVIDNLSFTVNEGDYLCIAGENGSGKSTLVKGLLSLKDISKGTIEYSPLFDPRKTGYLPQVSEIQKDFPASVWEVITSGFTSSSSLFSHVSKKQKLKALEIMEEIKISYLRNKSFRSLSGGQMQRVLLARSLCATSSLLLLDEPANCLDPVARGDLYTIIKKLNMDKGITVIMVTHDTDCIKCHATHVLHLTHGKPFFGTIEEYKKSEEGRRFLYA